jgi:hypothetical protein
MSLYGGDVLIAGEFTGSSTTQKNLVRLEGTTGEVKQWYNALSLKSVLVAPNLGRIYGGGESLSAFKRSGKKLWTKAKKTVESTLYPNAPSPSYRDLKLDGSTIWAACACDAVDGKAAKALVKLSTEGVHDNLLARSSRPRLVGDVGGEGKRNAVPRGGGQRLLGQVR